MKRIILFLLIIFSVKGYTQEIKVESFCCDEKDLTANRTSTEVLDQNGDKCALLRIQTTHKGFVFDVGSAGIQAVDDNRVGEIWLWVPYGIKHISIRHQTLGNLINYNFPIAVQRAKVYIMQLAIDSKIQYDDEKTKRISLAIHPKGSRIRLNGINVPLKDGRTEIDVPLGQHQLKIDCMNYESIDSVLVVNENSSTYNISLKPIFGNLIIESTPTSSKVYINRIERGVTPIELNNIVSGRHLIELKNSDDFSNYKDTIVVAQNATSRLNITLEKKIDACFEIEGLERNMKVFLDGEIMRVFNKKVAIKADKGEHDLLIKYNDIVYYNRKHTLVKDGELIHINLNNIKIKAEDVKILDNFADLSSYTYVGKIKEKYGDGGAFPSWVESNRRRCIRRLQEKAAKNRCTAIKLISEINRNTGFTNFTHITAEMYK